MSSKELWGVWTLIACKSETRDGKKIPKSVWGDNPAGSLIYTPGGKMSVHVLNTGRMKLSTDDARTGPIEEIKSMFEGYNAYYGTYTVNEDNGYVEHLVERDLIPNFDGDTLKRFFSIEQNRLTLRTPFYKFDGVESFSTLIWEKIEQF